jgi:DNA-binding protein YbaB
MRAQVEGLMADYERLGANGGAVLDRLMAVRGRASSEDDLIKVVVDPCGRLESLEIDPQVYRRPDTRWLAALITATVSRASADADGQVDNELNSLPSPADIQAVLDFDGEGVLRRFAEEVGVLPEAHVVVEGGRGE